MITQNKEDNGRIRRDDAGTDYRQSESDRRGLSESEQVPEQGVPSESTPRTGQGERVFTGDGSNQSGGRQEYDVNRKYSNGEIHDIVSSVTEVNLNEFLSVVDVIRRGKHFSYLRFVLQMFYNKEKAPAKQFVNA